MCKSLEYTSPHLLESYLYDEPYSPSSCEGSEDAGAKGENIPTAESFNPPSRNAGRRQKRAASPPRAVHSTAGRVTGPSGFLPLAGGHGRAEYPFIPPWNVDPYGSGQPLPHLPAARQLIGSILLRNYDSAALDDIQAEADSFLYNGSVRARNALFLNTELRTGSMLTGFLG